MHAMSCLFNSIAPFVGEKSSDVRNRICDYMQANMNTDHQCVSIGQWIEWQDGVGTGNVPQYVDKMRSAATWGGAMELAIATKVYEADITVFDVQGSVVAEFKCNEKSVARQQVRVQWTGSHYTPLI